MKYISSILLAASLSLGSATAMAEDQTGYAFDDGSVLIHCKAPSKDEMISAELFNAAFPNWIKSLQGYANEGLIARAHYLGELKEGIFMVVIGENKEAAMANAGKILAETFDIMKEAVKATDSEISFDERSGCQLLEIGPVAILPQ